MSDDYKILPGQVTQLTNDPGDPRGLLRLRERILRMRRGESPAYKTTVSKDVGPAETRIEVPPEVWDWMTPRGTCQKCGERPATIVWAPDGTMGLIHGGYRHWCARCALREQVAHARACAARLPELERQLAEEEVR